MHAKRKTRACRTENATSVANREKCAEVAALCACFNFRKASRAVTQLYDTILQPSGLRSTQFVILVGVSLTEPVNMAQLARALATDRTTLTRNLAPLTQRGLIQTTGGPDGRARLVRLTQQGKLALARAMTYWEKAQERFVGRLGPARWRGLLDGLTATVEATRGNQQSA